MFIRLILYLYQLTIFVTFLVLQYTQRSEEGSIVNIKHILKLNIFAFLYGLVLVIQSMLTINVYRLKRITHWLDFRFNTLFILVIFMVSSIAFVILTLRFLNRGKSRYLLVLLWAPYYFALYKLSWMLIPITHPGDKANPLTGLMLMGIYLLYPGYIAIINFLSTVIFEIKKDRELRKVDQ